MPPKTLLQRGFKAKAERLAKEYRVNLGIHPCAPLPASKLAEYLGINIYPATDFVNDSYYRNLLSGSDGLECEWSALTMTTLKGNKIIIHNPFHSEGRQESDLMHELAHNICNHVIDLSAFSLFSIPEGMRLYDEEQEEEAKCLGSTLQLATPCLLWARKRKMSKEEIASYFHATADMVKYRMNITGIARR